MASMFLIASTLLVALMMSYIFWRFCPSVPEKIYGITGVLFCLAAPGCLAALGLISDFTSFPSPLLKVLLMLFVLTLLSIASPWAERLVLNIPLKILVSAQSFRVLPEIFLLLAYREGIAPIQMTLHGRNLDILTAIISFVLFLRWNRLRHHLRLAVLHCSVGLLLLINVVATAIFSMPSPSSIRYFENAPSAAFIGLFPNIWLPSVHVVAALLLHGLTIRKIIRERLQLNIK
jgi:hypothetical protein